MKTVKIEAEQSKVDAEPEHEEDVVEWKCPDSLIALKEEIPDESK